MNQPLLDLHAVASRLSCSWKTAYRLVVEERRIPSVRIASRSIRVEPRDVEAYLQKRRQREAKPVSAREPVHSEVFR